jgi:hypothetical protein
MANWRRKVIALFPDLRREVQRRDFSIYRVFFDLLPRVRAAHESGDDETLRRIYGFTEWCFVQKAKDLWNAAGVAFYEHVFDGPRESWPAVVPWLSPQVRSGCWGLWEWRLTPDELARVRGLFADCRRPRYHEARLKNR